MLACVHTPRNPTSQVNPTHASQTTNPPHSTIQDSFAPTIPGVTTAGASDALFDNGKALATTATALLLPLVLNAGEAAAKGGEYGVLEGRTFAFIHPIVMGGLFLATAWTGYLGWQWRTVRTLAGEIKCVCGCPCRPVGCCGALVGE